MNLINFLKNKDHQLAILLLSVMIFVFLFLEQCSTNKGERLKYEQNLYALTDSVKVLKNKEGELVMVNQFRWAGSRLGRLDITFEKGGKNSCVSCDNMWVRN